MLCFGMNDYCWLRCWEYVSHLVAPQNPKAGNYSDDCQFETWVYMNVMFLAARWI